MTRRLAAASVAAAGGMLAVNRLRIDGLVSLGESQQGTVGVIHWLVVVAFAVFVAATVRAPWRTTTIAAIGTGLSAQLVLLLSAANVSANSDPTFFDNRVFYLYFKLVFSVILLLGGVLLGALAARLDRQRRSGALVPSEWLYLPVEVVFAYVLAEATIMRFWLVPVIGVAAWLTGLAMSDRLKAAMPLLRALVARSVVRHRWLIPLVSALIVFGLTIAFNVSLVRQVGVGFPTASDDGDFYDDLGWALATGTPYRTFEHIEATWAFRSPGYPLFVAAVYALFGRNFVALGVAQALCGVLVVLMVYSLGRRLFDRTVACVAAVLTASSGLLISVMSTLRSEAVYVVVSVALVWSLVAWSDARTSRRRAAMGALTGALIAYGFLVKPQLVGFVPFGAAWWIWSRRDRRPGSPAFSIAEVPVAVGAFALLLAPIVIRDVGVNGHFTLVGIGHATETWLINFAGARLSPLGVTSPDLGLLLSVFARRPAEVATILVQEIPYSIYAFFLGPWFGKGDPLQLQRYSELAHTLNAYTYVAALLGLALGWRWRCGRAAQLLLLSYVVLNTLVVVVFAYPSVRYRIPLDPLLFLWVAAGAVWLGRRVMAATASLRSAGARAAVIG